MSNPLIAKLRLLTPLSTTDLDEIERICCRDIRTHAAHTDITTRSSETGELHILVSGWACRYKTLPDGRRQFPALLVPGDTCDIDGLFVRQLDFSIAALTACSVAVVQRDELRDLIDRNPAVRDVFWWLTCVENAVATEWAVCLGRRSARERLAHLFCELLVRLSMVQLADENSYQLPLTQDELSDALGISVVHVNRVLQSLRSEGLLRLEGSRLTIFDQDALKRVGGFSPNYLHLEGLQLTSAASDMAPSFMAPSSMAPASA